MKKEDFLFPIKNFKIDKDHKIDLNKFDNAFVSKNIELKEFKMLPDRFKPSIKENLSDYTYSLGKVVEVSEPIEDQGFRILIDKDTVTIKAVDEAGFRYGLETFKEILEKFTDNQVNPIEIYDFPTLKKRGLMLDISRGKVYTLDYLYNLVDILKKLRMNVFQLYIEHTFEFESHPEISKGSGAISAKEILLLQERCKANGIELQANLQSLGHMNHILTRKEYIHLSESDMFWSLDTSSEESYKLLDEMYGEFLPLFESEWLNICSDEPYDLGKGKSALLNKDVGELYFNHIKRLHDLAAKYCKKIMLFGDVVEHYPHYAKLMPEDITYIDWIYDPKEVYGTPKLFNKTKRPFWVSPGTGNWNTLFPRFEGSITNIVNLTLEGIAENAQGMLLTDWNDHGGYTQPSPTYYSYAYAATVAWGGVDPGKTLVDHLIDKVLGLEGYSQVIHKLGSIYNVVPIWSKNRSQCVMALFEEPIVGKSLTGMKPPKELVAFDLNLPEGIDPVFDRHSQHPLRPYFSIPKAAIEQIREIVNDAKPLIANLDAGLIKDQLTYISNAFDLMLDKLDLSRRILTSMENKDLQVVDFIFLEDEISQIIRRFMSLQQDFIKIWYDISNHAEIEISLTYFANIISRYDYLRDWLSIQREQFNKKGVDWNFETYNSADYETLPTY